MTVNADGLVFIGQKGGRLHRSNFRKFWYRLGERDGQAVRRRQEN
jgi:hypothetical protein